MEVSTAKAARTGDGVMDALPRPNESVRPAEPARADLTADERSQIAARLRLSPSERLRYLEDMIAFEGLARRARRLT